MKNIIKRCSEPLAEPDKQNYRIRLPINIGSPALHKLFLAALVSAALLLGGSAVANADTQFAFTGDTDYIPQADPYMTQLISSLNAQRFPFVIHVGDTMGFQDCNLAQYQYILSQLQNSTNPIIYTPGDNEWLDCTETVSELSPFPFPRTLIDPLTAQASVRDIFFPTNRGGQALSLGAKPIVLMRQSTGDGKSKRTDNTFDKSKFVENQMFIRRGILVVTIDIPGSTGDFADGCVRPVVVNGVVDHFDGDLSNVPYSCVPEEREREAADLAWLHQAFAVAKENRVSGVVIASQPDMGWQVASNTSDSSCPALNSVLRDGSVLRGTTSLQSESGSRYTDCKIYEQYRLAIRAEARAFGKPVALLTGDRHFFRTWKPIDDTPNLVAVQQPGFPRFGWIRVTVKNSNPKLFSFSLGACTQGPTIGFFNQVVNPPNPPTCTDSAEIKVLGPTAIAGHKYESTEIGGYDTSIFGPPLLTLPHGTLTGNAVYVGRGCPAGNGLTEDDPYLTDPNGKIALIDINTICGGDAQAARAQQAGAIGVILVDRADFESESFLADSPLTETGTAFDGTNMTIPVVVVVKTIGNALKSAPELFLSITAPINAGDLVEIHG